jgi:hypothetical protein
MSRTRQPLQPNAQQLGVIFRDYTHQITIGAHKTTRGEADNTGWNAERHQSVVPDAVVVVEVEMLDNEGTSNMITETARKDGFGTTGLLRASNRRPRKRRVFNIISVKSQGQKHRRVVDQRGGAVELV